MEIFQNFLLALLVIQFFDVEAAGIRPQTENKVGEVLHCYCNLPECITTGYMCKTTTTESDASGSGGGCFSDLVPFMDVDRAVHGCLDLLPEERRTECRNVPISKQSRAGVGSLANTGKRKDTREAGSPDSGANMDGREDTKEDVPDPTRTANLLPPSLLLCCNQDMCNHVDSPETRNKYNQTILAVGAVVIGSGPAGEGIEWHKPPGTSDKNSGHESGGVSTLAWLKMATVLVSICGLLVLLALVLLAIRILKSESHHATHIATLDKFTGEQGELFLRLGGEGSCLGEKRPLGGIIFQENLTGRRPEEVHRHHLRLDHKNITNAKINSTAHADESARLLLVGKSVHVGSCNLLQEQPQVAPPFLTVEKLHYKRIPPLNHNINTLQ